MKRGLALLLVAFILSGCGGDNQLNRAMAMRERLLAAEGCSFDAEIAADYGDKVYTFSVTCQADKEGTLRFTVNAPESISGITGEISGSGGKLTFDSCALAFELLADGQVSPISAPWLLVHTLRGGYLTSCGMDGENLCVSIDDSYEEDALHLDIWLDSQDLPAYAEILWQGRRILSLTVKNFALL